jgi:hypothetical protein
MILKQNCYVISEAELNALETDNYTSPRATTFTGSSIQRRNKVTEQISFKEKKERLNPIEKPEHQLSDKSKAKIRQKLIAWSNCIPEKQNIKFSFITLTLTSKQIGDDKSFTKMQNTLFTYLRKFSGEKTIKNAPELTLKQKQENNRKQSLFSWSNYLYVLEKQKNGNIHSHIVVSSYVPIRLINKAWCKILSDNGYTYNQKGNVITPFQALVNAAKDKSLGTPSPVDISFVHDFKSVGAYITKYITKNQSVMHTQVWNCSRSISQLWTGARICARKHMLDLERFKAKTVIKLMDNGQNLYINILDRYTQLQKSIFSKVNTQYLFT